MFWGYREPTFRNIFEYFSDPNSNFTIFYKFLQ